jgi:excisionase family DNA binding protein
MTSALSIKQVAELLGVSAASVYREVHEGLMPHTRVRRRITITPEQLAEYRQRQAPAVPRQAGSFRHLPL